MSARAVAVFALAVLPASAAAGCGPTRSTPSGPGAQGGTQPPAAGGAAATQCGTARTAAGVPVVIVVEHGPAGCRIAMTVERGYTRAVASGKVHGNGGGAPVTIKGWVCQGFNTPQVLATGHASACRKNGAEILAVLPTPGSSASP
jgi:hypothetical protein